MNSPVQVVLNAQDYVHVPTVLPGGSNKDFYADRDGAFVKHRDRLRDQVLDIAKASNVHSDSEVVYAFVALQADAWAKSHRPVRKIFPAKHIGPSFGGPIGSMIVEFAPSAISEIAHTIASAESQTNWTTSKEGKRVAKPSRERSEVGAIDSIRLYTASDRRKFSTEQAINWLADRRTGVAYYVETFVSKRSIERREDDAIRNRQERALAKFTDNLEALNLPIKVTQISDRWQTASFFIVAIDLEKILDHLHLTNVHEKLLSYLDSQPLVRSIHLPPLLQTATGPMKAAGPTVVPMPANALDVYPVVGIIDSGVSRNKDIQAWSAGDSGMVFGLDQETDHGTFIAGLICASDAFNSGAVYQEEKCRYFDLGLFPTSQNAFSTYYPRGFLDFLEQLDAEIPEAKKNGARVFNMSLAVTTPVADASYSVFANLLDEIADRHDILFVLPAGNLDSAQVRDEWPSKPVDATAMLANYTFAGQDRIFQPADSIRSLVVGAVNPPNKELECLPARYTRRGPGPALGAKPDICHVGGRFEAESGLTSVSPEGHAVQSCGTSYAAPLAAKTLAAIDKQIAGGCTREALIALAIHHAEQPAALTHSKLKNLSRDFVGAGIPRVAADTLTNQDNEITLVFSGVLQRSQELLFNFAWPKSLVSEGGACSGFVKSTLVFRPPIDREHSGEFIRVNLDLHLRQELIDELTGETSFEGRLKQTSSSGLEKELVKHGAKWWPVKRSSTNLKSKGNSSQWRLVVDSLSRSEYSFPDEGVPFSVLLTIQDTTGMAIFNEMRQQLQATGTRIEDIRSAIRTRLTP